MHLSLEKIPRDGELADGSLQSQRFCPPNRDWLKANAVPDLEKGLRKSKVCMVIGKKTVYAVRMDQKQYHRLR